MPAMSPTLAAALADAILALHVGIVAFVVLGSLAIVVGGRRNWSWVRHRGVRVAHLALVAVIALQAWLGRLCPLTVWEQALRTRAGEGTYGESFIQHWLSRLLYFELPWWVFLAAYTALVLFVGACWWRWPPRRRRR